MVYRRLSVKEAPAPPLPPALCRLLSWLALVAEYGELVCARSGKQVPMVTRALPVTPAAMGYHN